MNKDNSRKPLSKGIIVAGVFAVALVAVAVILIVNTLKTSAPPDTKFRISDCTVSDVTNEDMAEFIENTTPDEQEEYDDWLAESFGLSADELTEFANHLTEYKKAEVFFTVDTDRPINFYELETNQIDGVYVSSSSHADYFTAMTDWHCAVPDKDNTYSFIMYFPKEENIEEIIPQMEIQIKGYYQNMWDIEFNTEWTVEKAA